MNVINLLRLPIQHWVLNPLIKWSIDTLQLIKNMCQTPLKELLRPQIWWSHVLKITQGDMLSRTHRYHCSSIENTYSYQTPSIMNQYIWNIQPPYGLTYILKSLKTLT